MNPRWLASLKLGLAISLAYYFSGKLGLFFESGGTRASALFPPAGIAIASALIYGRRVFPWIFLGALLVNVGVDLKEQGLSLESLKAASGIAVASTLQAVVASLLLRKGLGYPLLLDSGQGVLRFTGLVLLACMTAPTLATAWLYRIGEISGDLLPFVWLTWWVGDSLGGILVTPLVLTLVGEPAELWQSRRKQLAPLLMVGFLLISGFVTPVSEWERRGVLLEFELNAQHYSDQLQSRLSEQESIVNQLAEVMAGPALISRESFAHMAHMALRQFSITLQAVEWAPWVSGAQRPAFEQAQKRFFP
jgi:integral membrane sensor domain MASE1